MEYVATIEIYRSARGEGDRPVLMVGGSGTSHASLPPEAAMLLALDEAQAIVRRALSAKNQ